MLLDNTFISCGIYQLHGVSSETPAKVVSFVKKELKNKKVRNQHGYFAAHARPPIIIFNDILRGSHSSSDYEHNNEFCDMSGSALVKYITERGYGKVVSSGEYRNHSVTDNICEMWIWFLDYKALGLEELLASYA